MIKPVARSRKAQSAPRWRPEAVAEQFRSEGYAVARGLFQPSEIAEISEAFDRQWAAGMGHPASFRHGNLLYRQGEDPVLGRILRLAQWCSYVDPVLERVRRDPRFLDLLEPLLGRDLKQIINQLHWKPPGAVQAEFAFHQDVRFRRPAQAYRNLVHSYVQTGLAVDRHSAESGAMRILPGSHLKGALDLQSPDRILDGRMAEEALAGAGLDPRGLIDLELEPGDVALWSVFTIHGSGANVTGNERRFYLNGYVRAADCDRGEWAFRDGEPQKLGAPVLVHYEDLLNRPEPHYLEP